MFARVVCRAAARARVGTASARPATAAVTGGQGAGAKGVRCATSAFASPALSSVQQRRHGHSMLVRHRPTLLITTTAALLRGGGSSAASAARCASTMATRSPPTSVERSFQLPSGQVIAAKVWPSSGGPPQDPAQRILALHGYLDNANTWDLLAPALAEEGYEVVAMDFAGHGLSSHAAPDSWYDLMEYPHSVVAVQDALGWERCTYLSHSLGAGVASMVAGSFPERACGAVFIDALGPFTLSPRGAHTHLRRAVQSRASLRGKAQKVWPSFEAAVQARVAAAAEYPGTQTISKVAAERLMVRATEPVAPEQNEGRAGGVRFRYDLRLRAYSNSYLSEDAVHAFLSAIACPILVITGQAGFPLTGGFTLRADALGPRLTRHAHLPGSHHLHADPESWGGVRDAVLPFLAALPRGDEGNEAAAAVASAAAARPGPPKGLL